MDFNKLNEHTSHLEKQKNEGTNYINELKIM